MSCGYKCEYSCEECDVPDKVIEFVNGYNQALEDYITEIEKQTTFYCGKDSNLRQILEQLKR